MKRKTNIPQQPKVRSNVALSAIRATGGGTHGGGKKRRNRTDRQNTRRALRAGSEA